MASLLRLEKGKNPLYAVDYVDSATKTRKRIRLGRCGNKLATSCQTFIQKLDIQKRLNQPPDLETADWLAGLTDEIYQKLANAGLCTPRDISDRVTLGEFCKKYLQSRKKEIKESSILRIKDTIQRMLQYFGAGKRIHEIDQNAAKDFQNWLRELPGKKSNTISEATVRCHIRNTKTLFKDAVARGIIEKNPFLILKSSSLATKNERYVTPEEFSQILEHCPNHEWRLYLSLLRLAGLRKHEPDELKWSDVHWEKRMLSVHAKKTSQTRIVPLCPELLEMLQVAENHGKRSDNIISLSENNRDRTFRQIINATGIKIWKDIFQTLRRSCETQWASDGHPQSAVSKWIGHGLLVSERHYLRVSDRNIEACCEKPMLNSDLQQPTEQKVGAAECAAVGSDLGQKRPESGRSVQNTELMTLNKKTPEKQEFATAFNGVHENAKAPRVGLEPTTYGLTVRRSTN